MRYKYTTRLSNGLLKIDIAVYVAAKCFVQAIILSFVCVGGSFGGGRRGVDGLSVD